MINEISNSAPGPGQLVGLVIGHNRIAKDLEWQSGCGLVRICIPILVAQDGEHQRRCFPGDARKSEHDTGDNARAGGAQHN